MKKIGKLECLVREGDNDGFNVILLHGYGADAHDLAPLADFLDPEQLWNFYFPEGPREVPIGPMMTGKAWFEIAARDLEAGIDFTAFRPKGLDAAIQLVDDLIFQLDSEKLVLGGFSQGAMVTTATAMRSPEAMTALILWSGALLDQENWRRQAGVLNEKPFFQSHGLQDPVIAVRFGEKLYELLQSSGARGSFVKFNGGHEIPMPVLLKSREFLSGIFPS